jgi:hypothetical protein
VRADVDQVQRVELDAAVEMTRSDQVDLVGGARLGRQPGRIRNPFRNISPRASPRFGQARGRDDPLDRPAVRDRVDAHAALLPGDGQRTVLAARVSGETLSGVDLAQLVGSSSGRRQRRPGAALGPTVVVRFLVGPGRPFPDPAARPPQRHRYLLGALTRPASDRFHATLPRTPDSPSLE